MRSTRSQQQPSTQWQETTPGCRRSDKLPALQPVPTAQHARPAPHTKPDAAAATAAHERHARQLREIDRFGDSLRRMRKVIDAATTEGHHAGHLKGWTEGLRWGLALGMPCGAALFAGALWGLPVAIDLVAGWLA